MKLYDVDGYDTPKLLSEAHAELLGGREHADDVRPAKSARVAQWRAYASSLGLDADVAATMTRAELIEQYGEL